MPSVRSKSKETSKSSPLPKARDAGVDQVRTTLAEEARSSPVPQPSISRDVLGISKPEGESNMSSNSQRKTNKKGEGRDDSVLSSNSETSRADASDPLELFRSPDTFREEVRAKLLGIFKSISSQNDHLWRVIVLDERSTRVISSIVGMYDVMEAARVTCVENLFFERQPFTAVRGMDGMKVTVILARISLFFLHCIV